MPKKKKEEGETPSLITSRVLSTPPKGESGNTVVTSRILGGAGGADAASARKPSRASAKRATAGTKAKRTRTKVTTPPTDTTE